MLRDDIFRSFLDSSFFEPIFPMNNAHSQAASTNRFTNHNERCSVTGPRDLFNEFSRRADEIFLAATKSFFEPRMFFREENPWNAGLLTGREGSERVTLDGIVAELPVRATTGIHRHTNSEPVHLGRLQWHDSNMRRALDGSVPSSTRAEPNCRLTAAELEKLPLSIYRIKPVKPGNDSANGTPSTSSDLSPVSEGSANSINVEISPESAYLQPVSKSPTVVAIQPLQSSPARGQPECEVCLTEYRNRDQLRHLPCGHAFHAKCIDTWFSQSSTCPKCRAGVRTGLKRLERERRNGKSSSEAGAPAPIKAIQKRIPGGTATNSRVVNNSSGRSQPTRLLQQRLTVSRSPSSSESCRRYSTFEGLRTRMNQSVHRCQGRREATNAAIASRENRSASRTGSALSTTNESAFARLCISNPEAPLQDLSAIARRKAGEAAIRRAEQAERERNEAQANRS